MPVFVYNEGFGHRGVWHIADGAISSKVVPARESTYTYEVGIYKDPYDRNPELTGTFNTTISYWPEYTSRYVENVLCNQIGRYLGEGNKLITKDKSPWNKVGTFIIQYEVQKGRNIYEAEEPPPGPVCSRCIKKWKEAIIE